jgi:hypothetical protein
MVKGLWFFFGAATMLDWVNRHGVEVMLAYVVYNSAVQALPKPEGCNSFIRFSMVLLTR